MPHWPPPLRPPPDVDLGPECACPLTLATMTQPAVGPSGITYERDALLAWVRRTGKDPSTGEATREEQVFPNRAVRALVASRIEAAYTC